MQAADLLAGLYLVTLLQALVPGRPEAVSQVGRTQYYQPGERLVCRWVRCSSGLSDTHVLTRSSTALPRSWDPLNQTQFDQVTTTLRTEDAQILRDLAPDMGAYVSEADPTEPNWQDTFYGENYSRLLALKRRWDPRGVFWYKNAVGSELWEPKGPHGIENGVGQRPVQLCKVEVDV